jgi:hypothetical protein
MALPFWFNAQKRGIGAVPSRYSYPGNDKPVFLRDPLSLQGYWVGVEGEVHQA